MEYSIWQWKVTSVVIPKVLHMAPKYDQIEYSMWHEIVTTWSTPWGLFFMQHRVLHMANLESIFYPRNAMASYVFAILAQSQPFKVGFRLLIYDVSIFLAILDHPQIFGAYFYAACTSTYN